MRQSYTVSAGLMVVALRLLLWFVSFVGKLSWKETLQFSERESKRSGGREAIPPGNPDFRFRNGLRSWLQLFLCDHEQASYSLCVSVFYDDGRIST